MKHLGDITKISGYTAPIVDCIIGGSPCQDLSVAGKRAGLDGERSGLYMEQIRIVKKMREKDERNGRSGVDIRPRYMVWENVPGAFSSNKAEDFRIVLEELAKIKDKNAVIPRPADGKWRTSGCILGDGWSIAWRVLDTQFWGLSYYLDDGSILILGTPQRRKRIALVADFGGESAPEILFVRKSLSGNTDESEPKRKEPSPHASRGIRADDSLGADQYNGVILEPLDAPLCYDIGEARLRTPSEYKDVSPTLSARCGTGGNNTPAVITFEPGIASREGGHIYEGVSGTLRANAGDNQMATAYQPVCYKADDGKSSNVTPTIVGDHNNRVTDHTALLVYAVDQDGGKSACDVREGTSPTLTTQSNSAHSLNGNNVVRTRYIVRRLTPMECERLQGYPDGWTDIGEWTDSKGKKRQTSDAARYKALGNSIALPPWKWVLKRLCACYERDATMASLFDGIGGFPLLWEQLNGKGTCLWASEIEEFPMAVTKVRLGGV